MVFRNEVLELLVAATDADHGDVSPQLARRPVWPDQVEAPLDKDNRYRDIVQLDQPRYLEIQLVALSRVKLDRWRLKNLVALAVNDEVLDVVLV